MLEAHNGVVICRNSLGATAREIAMLRLDAETKGDVDKLQVSAMVKYLATAFLLRLDRRRYGELILLLKNDYAKQQQKLSQNPH